MTRSLLVLVLLAACHTDAPRFSDCHVAADISGPPMTVADGGAVDASPARHGETPTNGCEGFIAPPIPPSTSWVDTQSATGTCAAPPPVAADVCTTAGEMYASCESRVIAFDACAYEPGMQLCYGGLWTVVCRSQGDCPSGFTCDLLDSTIGTCQRPCHVSSDCGVCDLVCSSGMCASRPQPSPDAGPPLPDASF